MRYFNFFFLIIIFISCSNSNSKDNLELIVQNDIILNSGLENRCVNIIRFKIRNNSDNPYYINNLNPEDDDHKLGILSDGINIYIYNQNGKEITYNYKHFKDEDAKCVYYTLMENAEVFEKNLGYKRKVKYLRNFGFKNFFIHPKETIYFEYPIDLSGPVGYEAVRIGYADLNKNEKYYAKIALCSGSSNYESELPRDIVKTIQENKYIVYNGIIKSKNKTPIVFK